MRALSQKVLGRLHFTLEQVQDLTPTPMTLSSVMFYTGIDPYTGAPLYVARNQDDKRRQKSYFFRENQRPSRPQKGAPNRVSKAVGAKVGAKTDARTGARSPKRRKG